MPCTCITYPRLPPVAGDENIPVVLLLPTGLDPRGAGIRRALPPTVHPGVLIILPRPISRQPHGVRKRLAGRGEFFRPRGRLAFHANDIAQRRRMHSRRIRNPQRRCARQSRRGGRLDHGGGSRLGARTGAEKQSGQTEQHARVSVRGNLGSWRIHERIRPTHPMRRSPSSRVGQSPIRGRRGLPLTSLRRTPPLHSLHGQA